MRACAATLASPASLTSRQGDLSVRGDRPSAEDRVADRQPLAALGGLGPAPVRSRQGQLRRPGCCPPAPPTPPGGHTGRAGPRPVSAAIAFPALFPGPVAPPQVPAQDPASPVPASSAPGAPQHPMALRATITGHRPGRRRRCRCSGRVRAWRRSGTRARRPRLSASPRLRSARTSGSRSRRCCRCASPDIRAGPTSSSHLISVTWRWHMGPWWAGMGVELRVIRWAAKILRTFGVADLCVMQSERSHGLAARLLGEVTELARAPAG